MRSSSAGRGRVLLAAGAGVAVVLWAVAIAWRARQDQPYPTEMIPARAVWEVVDGLGAGDADLGLAGDVAADGAGRVYVLDAARQRIGMFRRSRGAFAWTGGPGGGPGEFIAPAALAATVGGMVYVANRGNRRLERYLVHRDELRYDGSVPLDFDAQDLCAVEDRLIVLGARGEWLLHEVSPVDGRVLRSFARDPLLRDPLLATHRAAGYMACGADGEVAYLPLIRPVVYRFSAAAGARVDSATIPGYRETIVTRRAGSVTLSEPPEGPADCAASLVRLRDGRLLVQVGTLADGGTHHEFDEIRSFILSPDERVARPIDPLPRVMTAVADAYAAAWTAPVPHVRLVRLTLAPP